MRTDTTQLYATAETGDRVSAYSAARSSPLPAHIAAYHAHASAARADSHMMSSNFQSQLHVLLAHAVGAKRVLEVGVYVGYSAMVWAHAAGPDGLVTGLERSPEYAQVARAALADRGIANVDIIVGDAAETLPALRAATPYDLVFIDADKPGYSTYLDLLLSASRPGGVARLLRPGALVIADNTLRRGLVADAAAAAADGAMSEPLQSQVEALRSFNDKCVAEPRLETFLMPLWDGVSVMRLRD